MANRKDVPDPEEVRRRFENWKKAIWEPYNMAFWLLLRRIPMPFEQAWDCLNTAIATLLKQWEKVGPPENVENWASYLAKAAQNVYLRRPTRDNRLLVFRATIPDAWILSLEDPAETAAIRDEFSMALGVLMELPNAKAGTALFLWTLGWNFAEIARVLNTTAGNARVLKHHAMKDLTRSMKLRSAI